MYRAGRFLTCVAGCAMTCLLCPALLGQNNGKAGNPNQSGSTTVIPGELPGIRLVSPVPNGTWTTPAGDYANTRFSPLAKINTTNVQNLHITAMMATGIPHGHEGQPLVVNNTLYMVTPYPNNLIALDITKPGFPQKWIYSPILTRKRLASRAAML